MTHHFNSSISGRVSKEAKIKIAYLDKQQSREQRGEHIKARRRKSFLTMWPCARKSCLGLKERTAPRTGLLPAEQQRHGADFCNLQPAASCRMECCCREEEAGRVEISPCAFPFPHHPLSNITKHRWPWSFVRVPPSRNLGLAGRGRRMIASLHSRHQAQNTA